MGKIDCKEDSIQEIKGFLLGAIFTLSFNKFKKEVKKELKNEKIIFLPAEEESQSYYANTSSFCVIYRVVKQNNRWNIVGINKKEQDYAEGSTLNIALNKFLTLKKCRESD